MDFDALRLFLAVSEQKSFTRASVKLGVTQPVLSRHIRRLEEEFGAPLFYRNGRGVSLTEAGIRLSDVAVDVLQKLDGVKEDFLAGGASMRGAVTLGLPPSLGATLSPPLFRSFQSKFPEAKLRIMEGFSGTLLEWVETGRTDAAVLYDARTTEVISTAPLIREDLYLIEGPKQGRKSRSASISELRNGSFLLSGSIHGLRRVIDTAARDANISMDIRAEIDSVAALKSLVAAGPERTILPFGAVYEDVQAKRLTARRFEEPNMRALLVLATPLHRPVTKLARALIALVRSETRAILSNGHLSGQMEVQHGPKKKVK